MNELLIFVAIFSLQIADTVQTIAALSTGMVEEKNPLMRFAIDKFGFGALVFIKLFASTILFIGLVHLYGKDAGLANWTLAIIVVMYMVVICFNAYQNNILIWKLRA